MTFRECGIGTDRARGVPRGAVAALMTIVAVAAGCGGSPDNRALDPANELPFGVVDMPSAAAQLSVQSAAGGWAMDDRGVREVRIYVDGRFLKSTTLNTERPDVSKAFPQYARGTNLHGWTVNIEFYAPGAHTLLVQAVDSDGATRDIGVVSLTSRDQ